MPRLMSALLVPALAVAAVVPFAGCQSDSPWPERPGPKAVATFAPLHCFALNVAGDDASVQPLLTVTGPHHADIPASKARLVARADVLFAVGLGLDDRLAKRMRDGAGNPNLLLVELGAKLPEDLLLEGSCSCCAGHDHAHAHKPGEADEHEHTNDPHVWLGIDQAVVLVNGMRDALKAADPAHAAAYDARAAEYAGKLQALKAEGKDLLKDKKDRKLVTFHESLTYFADSFGLEIVDVVQKTPGKEPTAKELDKLIDLCVKEKVRVIAVEPQYTTQTSAARIKKELEARGLADVRLVEIDPLETANPGEVNAGWYETKTRANLRALADALK